MWGSKAAGAADKQYFNIPPYLGVLAVGLAEVVGAADVGATAVGDGAVDVVAAGVEVWGGVDDVGVGLLVLVLEQAVSRSAATISMPTTRLIILILFISSPMITSFSGYLAANV